MNIPESLAKEIAAKYDKVGIIIIAFDLKSKVIEKTYYAEPIFKSFIELVIKIFGYAYDTLSYEAMRLYKPEDN